MELLDENPTPQKLYSWNNDVTHYDYDAWETSNEWLLEFIHKISITHTE